MLKKTLVITALLMCINTAIFSQIQHTIKWSYGLKLRSATKAKTTLVRIYEVRLRAILDADWHIYSEKQPLNAVCQPTMVTFNPRPKLSLVGKIKELGKLIIFMDPSSGLAANEYSNTVDFVQVVSITGRTNLNISGKIIFQTCTDHMCLQPDSVNFNIPIKEVSPIN